MAQQQHVTQTLVQSEIHLRFIPKLGRITQFFKNSWISSGWVPSTSIRCFQCPQFKWQFKIKISPSMLDPRARQAEKRQEQRRSARLLRKRPALLDGLHRKAIYHSWQREELLATMCLVSEFWTSLAKWALIDVLSILPGGFQFVWWTYLL